MVFHQIPSLRSINMKGNAYQLVRRFLFVPSYQRFKRNGIENAFLFKLQRVNQR